jgi:hypothetical protein
MARKIATLFALFIVSYLGAHFYIRWKNRIQYDTIKTSSLIECEPNQIRSLKILQREGVAEQMLVFERIDTAEPGLPPAAQLAKSEWKESSPAVGEADTTVMNHLVSQICELYDPIPLRTEEMVDAAVPGRRAKRMEISILTNGKVEQHEMDFGPVSSDRQNVIRYRSPNGERVVKIVPQLLQLASKPPKDFLNLRVFRVNTDNTQAAIISFDGKEKFVLERQGADWRVTSAGKEMKPGREVERYLNTLTTLRAKEVVPGESADCEKKPHKAVIQLTAIGGRKELAGFDYGKKGPVAACDSARATKFTVDPDIVKYLDLPMKPTQGK